MLDDTQIKAEQFDNNDYPSGFTAQACVYNR
jgi:hypothetical protein